MRRVTLFLFSGFTITSTSAGKTCSHQKVGKIIETSPRKIKIWNNT